MAKMSVEQISTKAFYVIFKPDFYLIATKGVATAQGKRGIWKSIFPDRENTGNLLKNIKNMFLHREFTTNTGKIWVS